MTKRDEDKVKIEKKKEMRTKEISKMISEGGLGADNYYEIKKDSSSSKKASETSKNDQKEK